MTNGVHVALPVTPIVTPPVTPPGAAGITSAVARSVTPPVTSVVTPVVTSAPVDRITIAIALAMATVSAGFSIYGWTNVYGGAFWPVIALSLVLEAGKLRGIFLIGAGRGAWWVRLFLAAAVAVLMGLNAAGAYGFLAKAHIAAAVASETEIAKRIADIDGRIAEQRAKLADIDKRLGQIDGAINKAPLWRLRMTSGITGAF